MLLVSATESSAGLEGEAGRTVGEIANRRKEPGRLCRVGEVPHAVGYPAIGRGGFESDLAMKGAQRLVVGAPAGVCSFHEIDQAGEVTEVGVVIDREGVSDFVESDFFGVAQAGVENFEASAIRLEAESSSLVGEGVGFSFGSGEVHTAVAHGAVDASVGAEGEAVEVVSGKGDAHSKAILDNEAFISVYLTVFIEIREGPNVRNTSKVDDPFVGEDSSSSSV